MFVRRNKTISAAFRPAAIMSIIERNYRTYCAQNNIPLDDSPLDGEDAEMVDDDEEEDADDGMDMDVDDGMGDELDFFAAAKKETSKENKRKMRGKVGKLVTEKVRKVLEETELGEKRAGKLDETDYLRLLYAFNKEGIHFS